MTGPFLVVPRPEEASSPGELGPGEVHVWQAVLDDGADEETDGAVLSDRERRRAARFAGPGLRRRFVRSRALLRRLLAGYAGCAPGSLVFEEGAEGKPYLAGSPIRFNLTHSGPLWAVAAAVDRELGIDLERTTRRLDVSGVSRRMFSPAEQEAVRGLPDELRVTGFFRCWATREAIVKAMGVGMFSLDESFEVDLDPRRPLAVRAGDGFPWCVGTIPVADGAIGVLATEGAPDRIRSWTFVP